MSRSPLVTYLLIVLLTASVLLVTFGTAGAAQVPQIINIDEGYTETVRQGTEARFKWRVSNVDPDANYTVTVRVDSDKEWDYSLSKDEFTLKMKDNPGNWTEITLTVKTDNRAFGDEGRFTVAFDFVRESNGVQSYKEKMCTVKVSTSIETSGLDIFGFHIDISDLLGEEYDRPWIRFGISVVVYMLIGLILYWILIPLVRRLTRRTKTDVDDQIIEIIRKPLLVIIFSYAVVSSLSRLDLPDRFIYYVMMAFYVVLIFMVAWSLSRVSKVVLNVLGGIYAKRTAKEDLHKTVTPVFQKTLSFVIYFIALMMVFDQLGIYVTPFLASVGVMGLVIALAAQETLSNLFAGIMILADRPYKVGDILQFDESYYEVQRIGFRSTTMRNIFRNYVVNYPNRVLEKNKIINEFQPDRRYFLFRFMTLDYETDVIRALAIIRETAYDHPSVIKNDKRHSDPSARIKKFTDNGVSVYLWCYIYDWWDQWLANDEILQEVLRRFKKEGIKLAYPTRILQFDKRSPMHSTDDESVGVCGMGFEGISLLDPSEMAEAERLMLEKKKANKTSGMRGMKRAVETQQAKLKGNA